MVSNHIFVLARSANRRPTLQHELDVDARNLGLSVTRCGVDITGWSRAYQSQPIPEILCLRCKATTFHESHRKASQ